MPDRFKKIAFIAIVAGAAGSAACFVRWLDRTEPGLIHPPVAQITAARAVPVTTRWLESPAPCVMPMEAPSQGYGMLQVAEKAPGGWRVKAVLSLPPVPGSLFPLDLSHAVETSEYVDGILRQVSLID